MRLRFLIQQYLVLFFFIINVSGQRFFIHQPPLKHKLEIPNRELSHAFVDSSTSTVSHLYAKECNVCEWLQNFYKTHRHGGYKI